MSTNVRYRPAIQNGPIVRRPRRPARTNGSWLSPERPRNVRRQSPQTGEFDWGAMGRRLQGLVPERLLPKNMPEIRFPALNILPENFQAGTLVRDYARDYAKNVGRGLRRDGVSAASLGAHTEAREEQEAGRERFALMPLMICCGVLIGAGFLYGLSQNFSARALQRDEVRLLGELDQAAVERQELEVRYGRAASPARLEQRQASSGLAPMQLDHAIISPAAAKKPVAKPAPVPAAKTGKQTTRRTG
ncbi:MAG: hypothetical protein ACKV2V_03390 [Blastocatellia bacterium]